MTAHAETWCDRDGHKLFEYFVDFNEWLDSDEAVAVREANNIDGFSVPSKAFYAGDNRHLVGMLRLARNELRYRGVIPGTLSRPVT